MKHYRSILIIGVMEILIGGIALLSNLVTVALSTNTKSPNVLLFVIVTGIVSTWIGMGILTFRKLAYQFLLYFSSVIILSKILILMDIMQFNGALETAVPPTLKNIISIGYHGFILYYLSKSGTKQLFHN